MKKPNTEKAILFIYSFIILCVIAVCFAIIPKLIKKNSSTNLDETTTIVTETTETTTDVSSNNTTSIDSTDGNTTDVTETTIVCDTTTNTVLTEQVETTNNTTVPTNSDNNTSETTKKTKSSTTKETDTKTTKTNTVLETTETTTVPTNETVIDNTAVSDKGNSNYTFVKSFSRGTYYCYGCEKTGGSGRKLISCAVGDGYAKGSIASSYLFRNYGYNYNGKRTTVYLEIPDVPSMNGLYYLDDSDAGNSEVIDFFYISASECQFNEVGVIHVNCYI